LSSFLHATILEHSTFQESLAFVLSNRLATTTLLPTQLYDLFCE
jgi:serine O-acetyltransferase